MSRDTVSSRTTTGPGGPSHGAGGPSDALDRPQRRAPKPRAWGTRAPLLPALLFMVIVTQLPFVATLIISFMNWNALYPNDRGFAGLDNFKTAFTDPDLRNSIFNTILYTVVIVLVALVLGFVLAMMLDRSFRGRGFVRTILIAPFLVVPVAAALVWKHAIFNPEYGLLNGTITWVWQLFGSNNPPQPDWITNTPKLTIMVALIWQWTPFMMLILLAGLQGRPLDVIEAAQVDGANPVQIFRHMTLPYMRQYLELAGLLGSIYIVQNFDYVFTMTSGGLGSANLPYTIYQTFYQAHDYGLASAAGVIVVVGTIILATFALRTVSTLLREDQL